MSLLIPVFVQLFHVQIAAVKKGLLHQVCARHAWTLYTHVCMSSTHWKLANIYTNNVLLHRSIQNAKDHTIWHKIRIHQQGHSQKEMQTNWIVNIGYSSLYIKRTRTKKRTGRPRKIIKRMKSFFFKSLIQQGSGSASGSFIAIPTLFLCSPKLTICEKKNCS